MTKGSNMFCSFEDANIHGVNYRKDENKVKCPKCQIDGTHNPKDTPLSVSVSKGTWNCHHCTWKGKITDKNYTPMIKKEYTRPKEFTSRVSQFWVDWFKARGIDQHVLEYFELGDFEYKESKWIKFPYKRNKELVNAKSRSDKKEFRLSPGAEMIFFNLDAINEQKECVITEGEIDCMSLYQANIFNAVSVPNGASKGSMKLEYLDNCGEYFVDMEKVILFTDNDEPGIALREELARRIGRHKCWIIIYPENCKDANEVLQIYGSEYLNNLIKKAEPHPVDDVSKPSKSTSKVKDYFINGYPNGDKLGYQNFDELLSFRPGELTIISGIPNSGKALDINTPIPTLNGWKNMGEISVGDILFDENGNQCNVVAVTDIMENRPCYKMKFSDGTEIICDENHNWLTRDDKARRSEYSAKKRLESTRIVKNNGTDQSHKRTFPSVKTTKLISETLTAEKGKRLNHAIKNSLSLKIDEVELPIPPYTLGAWLGDGTSASGGITFNDPEILDYIREDGFESNKTKPTYGYYITGLLPYLRSNNLLKNKHIPKIYLRGSIDQRMALLHGLMDTDGYMGMDGRCEFCSVRKDLAEGVFELVASLGGIPRIFEGRAKLYGKDCGPKFRVFFTPNFPAFRLKRKLNNQRDRDKLSSSRIDYRYIESCEKIDSVPVKCIQVDSPSHLFLCGKSMIPTHNSAVLDQILIRLASRCEWKHAVLSREQWPHDIHVTKMVQIFSGKGLHDKGMTEEMIDDSIKFLDEHFFLFGIKELTVTGILEKAKELVLKHGIKSLTIDPWNTLTHDKSGNDSETDYVNEVLKQFVAFKDMYSVHVFLVAHPKKMQYEGTGENKKLAMPGLYDIAGSSNFFNVMDNGLIVYRNLGTRVNKTAPLGDTVTLSVQKVRNFFIGKQGTQNFDYNFSSGVYAEEHADFESELAFWKFKNKKIDALPLPIKYDKEIPPLTDISKMNIKTSFDIEPVKETEFKFESDGGLKPNIDIDVPF